MICAEDFFNKTEYNNVTLQQMWLTIIQDSHDSICKCHFGFAHLLAAIFPPGHQDRDKTITEILQRDFAEKCRSGGLAGDAFGMADTRPATTEQTEETKEENTQREEEDLDHILAAAAAVAEEG